MIPHFTKPQGVPITEKIQQSGASVHPATLMMYLKQILQLFEYLNEKGYHYGHIKTENIFVSITDSVEVLFSDCLIYQVMGSSTGPQNTSGM
jgi:hypothetical protein